jgi:hypothetical protein
MTSTLDKVSYWQIGSGQGEKDYSDKCLKYGVAFVGERCWDKKMERVQENDVVVLRRGTRHIMAVGRAIKHRGEVTGLADEEKKMVA